MPMEEELFDLNAGRFFRNQMAEDLKRVEHELSLFEDPAKMGDVAQRARFDSPEAPLTDYLKERAIMEAGVRAKRDEMVAILEIIDKKIEEHESG